MCLLCYFQGRSLHCGEADKKGSKPKEDREREMLYGLLRDMHIVWRSLGVIWPSPWKVHPQRASTFKHVAWGGWVSDGYFKIVSQAEVLTPLQGRDDPRFRDQISQKHLDSIGRLNEDQWAVFSNAFCSFSFDYFFKKEIAQLRLWVFKSMLYWFCSQNYDFSF